jgi:CheY-like chemotaxis protein
MNLDIASNISPSEPQMTPNGLMFCDDLIFFSRVEGVARSIGLFVRQEKNAADLLAAAQRFHPAGVIIDLHNPGLDLPTLLNALRTNLPAMPHIVAYGSHVEAELLRAARKAGCDQVLPRSQFVEDLQTDLPKWLGKE